LITFLKVVLRFVADIVFGVIGFATIGLAAFLLSKFIRWLEDGGVPSPVISVLDFLEYGLFMVDILGFVFLVGMSFYKMVVEIWELRNKP
jgi:hypothetical protein